MDDGWLYELDGQKVGPIPLTELQRLLRDGKLPRSTMVWARGLEKWVEAGTLPVLFAISGLTTSTNDAALAMVLPIGRSGLAIAAGYLGLFSFIPIFAPLALLFGGLAARDLRRHPEKRGWGRVVTAFVMGGAMTAIYGWLLLGH
jgi:hypothetical protein